MRLYFLVLFIVITSAESSLARVFILGDSLTCGSFGKELFLQFSQQDSDVTLYCAVSSRPEHWVNSENPKDIPCKTMTSSKPTLAKCGKTGEMPSLKNLVKEAKDAKVVIALGTNSLGYRSVDENHLLLAQALSIDSKSCFWVGPPHLDPVHKSLSSKRSVQIGRMDTYLTEFYSILKLQLGSLCTVVDSRESTRTGIEGHGTFDGIHRLESAGKFWAQNIFSKL